VRLPADLPGVALGSEQRRAFFNAVKTALQTLKQLEVPKVELICAGKSPFELTLRYSGPDVFSAEMELPTTFGITLQKLKDTSSSFLLQPEGETVTLRFILYHIKTP